LVIILTGYHRFTDFNKVVLLTESVWSDPFERVGFRVGLFASAEHFLKSADLPDTACLILDLRMPGMDGLELQRRLALSAHPIPIIFVTSHGDEATRTRALHAGAVSFLIQAVQSRCSARRRARR
jgi:FixJ family two-component response regulator